MSILSLRDVNKAYTNHKAVDNVSFEMPKGCIFGMLGPNGAGKTSLIRIITCITRADSGTIYFDGEILNERHPEMIGYMPEERGLYKKMKVGEHLIYLAVLKGMPVQTAKKEIAVWMEKFDIDSWYNKKIEELSKGMQQKIQFISTVVHKPKLLILDEPFSGLDPINANLIKDEISNLNNEGISVIFSTHRMEQVEEICDEMVLINKGKNVLSGKVAEIKDRFKENKFEISYSGNIPGGLIDQETLLESKPGKLMASASSLGEMNQILAHLIQNGVVITKFEEILPSINEIFIKTVTASGEAVKID
ncbi:MAG: ATP-binding cassette domain-containing protein [Saprospiraceae bacterium]|jgi:ABC-2 type transport system ATP-binding protein|nr:ATP-binding cassette domain-containing protein [Saprospiraceae bacterium]